MRKLLLLLLVMGCAQEGASWPLLGAAVPGLKKPFGSNIGNGAGGAAPVPEDAFSFTQTHLTPDGTCSTGATGQWSLDEASGAIVSECAGAESLSANGTPVYSKTGPTGIGDAIEFDGATEYFSLADDADYDVGTGDFCVAAAVRFRSGSSAVLSKHEGGVGGWYLYYNANNLRMGLQDSGGTSDVACTGSSNDDILADGSWHVITVGIDRDSGAGSRCTIDDVASGTIDITARSLSLDNAGPLWLGRITTFYADGDIGDVAFFKGASAITDCEAITWDDALDPETGDSVPTFVRATGSTAYDPVTQTWKELLAGVPAIGARLPAAATFPATDAPTGYRGAQIMYHRAQDNEDLITNWTQDACVTAAADTSDSPPEPGSGSGMERAEKFTLSGCSADVPIFERTMTVLSNRVHDMKVWLRSDDASSNTVTITCADTDETYSTDVELTASWVQYWHDETSSFAGGETTITCGVYADGTDNPVVYAIRPHVWRQERDFIVPDIATAGSDVTTNAEALSLTNINPFIDGGTMAFWVNPSHFANYSFATWDSTHDLIVDRSAGAQTLRVRTVGLADNMSATTTNTIPETGFTHACIRSSGSGGLDIALDGVDETLTGEDVFTEGGTYGTTVDDFSVGAYTRYLEFFDDVLTESDCLDLYNRDKAEMQP